MHAIRVIVVRDPPTHTHTDRTDYNTLHCGYRTVQNKDQTQIFLHFAQFITPTGVLILCWDMSLWHVGLFWCTGAILAECFLLTSPVTHTGASQMRTHVCWVEFQHINRYTTAALHLVHRDSLSLSLSLSAIFPGEPGLADFIGTKDDESGSDNYSYKTCKALVKSSPPTNQHPMFYRPDALPFDVCHMFVL